MSDTSYLETWCNCGQALDENEIRVAVGAAVENDYRLIDTAYCYNNEEFIGNAIGDLMKNGKLKRENIFITTKIPGQHLGSRERIRKCFETSLANLGVTYVDLYLIHSPIYTKENDEDLIFPMGDNGKLVWEDVDLVDVWKHLEELVDEGKIKAIGVSNFNSEQIQRIHEKARHPISNVQVECHAYLAQNELFKFCKERKITFTAYAPLGSPGRPEPFVDENAQNLMSDEVIVSLAKKHDKTQAQILLRNLIQRGIAVIPKSKSPARIKQNAQVFDFELSDADMAAIAKLNCNERCFSFTFINGIEEHPDYPFIAPY